MGRVRKDVMRRQTLLVLRALPSARLTAISVPLQDCVAPLDVLRVLKTGPRPTALPEWMCRSAQDRSAFPLGGHSFGNRLGRSLPSPSPLSNCLALRVGEPSLARVCRLDRALVFGVLAQAE